MKKIFYTFILLIYSVFAASQIVTTNPSFITGDYVNNLNGTVEVIFDATKGNAGLKDYTGDVYAHTGVITTESTSDSDWKHAPTWGDNSPKYKLARLDANKYRLLITPSIAAYYNLSTDEVVEKLAFVFRSETTPYKEGKDVGNADIFVDIVPAGLNVKFDSPDGNQLFNVNSTVNFAVSSSIVSNLTLTINNEIKQTAAGSLILNFSQTFSTAGDYLCIAEATINGQTARDTVNICVVSTSQNATLPAGVLAGINYNTSDPAEVTLVLYAKDKNNILPDNIFVIGDFNDWTYSNAYQMKHDETTGNWWITLTNLTPQQEYAFQYAVKKGDTTVKITDAYCEKILDPWNDTYIHSSIYPDLKKYPTGKTDGLVSVLQTQKPDFQWSQQTVNFQRKDKNNLVIYELWIHDYSTYRSVEEVIKRLDYLQSLGVNALELMPITEFDGNISWGYNPNHYFAPDKAYGTETAYKTLIDECHKRGIAVILDMVFNQSTGNNPFAKLYWNSTTNNVSSNNPYFNVTAPHSYNVFQDFNHGFSNTRDYFKRVLKFWMQEYRVDGFRMDLTQGFCSENCTDRVAIINDYYNDIKTYVPDVYFILEHWVPGEEQGFVNNGMICWRNTNNAYSQTAMGWLEPSNVSDPVYTTDAFSAANQKGWVSYAGSHDEERNFYKAKEWGNGDVKTDEVIRLNRVPINLAFNVLLQGPKMIWQFDEMGYDFSIHTCEDGTVNTNGDCRTSSKPVPDELEWFSNDLRMSIFNKVAQIVNLRTNLRPDIFEQGTIIANVGSGVALRTILWEYNGTKILVLGNFNVTGATEYVGNQTYTIPAGMWYDYLNDNDLRNGNSTVTLQPGELLIFTNDNNIEAPDPQEFNYTSDSENITVGKSNIYIYPTLVDNKIYIQSENPIRNVQIIALRGGAIRIYTNKTDIDISDLLSGMYLVVVTTDKEQYAQKILKH